MTSLLDIALALVVLLPPPVAAWLHVRRRRHHADPYRVARLEYELGLTDEPPGWSDTPGAVVYYRPGRGLPLPQWGPSEHDWQQRYESSM